MIQKYLIITLLIVLILSAGVSGQFYFGKNKIQYSEFDWKVLSTTHFKVYFYESEAEIAEIAAAAAEESYKYLSDRFNHHIFKKIPLIIYSSPSFFAQTNIIPAILPENVAGFTEFFKGRMVIPFNGSVSDFKKVVRHELVHVFQTEKIQANLSEHRKTNWYGAPLWFTEGQAELWSGEWDSQADMVMADMTINGRLRTITQLGYLRGTYFMYKFGESFLRFVVEHYGEDKIMELYENWWKAKNFSELFKLTTGKSLKEIGDEWVYSLKKKYYPKLENADLPSKIDKNITPQQFAVKPMPLTVEYKGISDWVVYKANKLGYSGIYLCSPSTGKEETLIKGERSAEFESLHLLNSRIGASTDGRFAFISKNQERDVLYIYSMREGKVSDKYVIPNLYHLASPAWSSDSRQIVFSGATRKGAYDIYHLDLYDSLATQLTDDIYYDTNPIFASDGTIVFSSDRGGYGYEGFNNLFKLDIATETLTPLTFGRYNDSAPQLCDAGILFSSDRHGSADIYLLKDNGDMFRLSNILTGAYDPVVRDSNLYYTGYQDLSYSIYSAEFDSSKFIPVESSPPVFTAWNPEHLPGKYEEGVLKYSNEFSFDIAQSAISYDAVYGSIGGIQTVFSDILGNEMFYMLVSNTASTKDEFFKSFNAGITYVNKTKRLNYGFGVFHLFDEYFDDFEGLFSERQSGVLGLLSYPLSKFNRVETSIFLRHSFKRKFLFEDERHAILSTNHLSYVYDNSLWDISGPIDGMRYNFTLGLTTDFYSATIFNKLAFVDIRHYLRIKKFSAFATRLFWFSSSGKEPQRIYFGGSWSMRGYDRKQWYARNVILISNELRFPLIDNLYIGFPFGRIGFQAIRGALFFDVGSAWNNEFDRMSGGVGVGARVSLGYLAVLRFDLTKKTDFRTFQSGLDFDFFFGWNF